MNNELYHYGIIGMKWGVRRTPEELGHRKSSTDEVMNTIRRSSGNRETKALKEARRKDINAMSNQELREANERLNLEQNYTNLTKGKLSKAKDWVAKTIISGIVVGSVATVTKEVVKVWLKSQFGIAS